MTKEGLKLPDHLDQIASDIVDDLRDEWQPTNDEIVFEIVRRSVLHMEDEHNWNNLDGLDQLMWHAQIIQYYARMRHAELEQEAQEVSESLGSLFQGTKKGLEKVASVVNRDTQFNDEEMNKRESPIELYKGYCICKEKKPWPIVYNIYVAIEREVAGGILTNRGDWQAYSNSLAGCHDIIDANFDLDKAHELSEKRGIVVGNIIIPDGKITSIDDDIDDAVKEMEEVEEE